jgi:3-hydroxyisobutyrate dehydrogenase-like beta-hydroxyacid dehydrogenase
MRRGGAAYGGSVSQGLAGRGGVTSRVSTVGPDAIRSVGERVPEGVIVVDSPVRGSVPEASDGKLDIFVGATEANIESDTYPPNFKLSLALKDMRLVTEAASGTGRDLKLAEASRAWLDEAAEAGAGDLDFSAVVATILGHRAQA